jgi:hypothetical protein
VRSQSRKHPARSLAATEFVFNPENLKVSDFRAASGEVVAVHILVVREILCARTRIVLKYHFQKRHWAVM